MGPLRLDYEFNARWFTFTGSVRKVKVKVCPETKDISPCSLLEGKAQSSACNHKQSETRPSNRDLSDVWTATQS